MLDFGLSHGFPNAVRRGTSFFFWLPIEFFFAFAIIRTFSAQASRNSSQLFTVPSIFPIFFSLLAFICVSLHFLSNPWTDFGNGLALWIAGAIAVLVLPIKEYFCVSSSFAIWGWRGWSLKSSSRSAFFKFGPFILLRRRRELRELSTVWSIHWNRIGWWSELWSNLSSIPQDIRLLKLVALQKQVYSTFSRGFLVSGSPYRNHLLYFSSLSNH